MDRVLLVIGAAWCAVSPSAVDALRPPPET